LCNVFTPTRKTLESLPMQFSEWNVKHSNLFDICLNKSKSLTIFKVLPIFISLWESKRLTYLRIKMFYQQEIKKSYLLLRPMAQLYGQVSTDWNQCVVIDCSLSHPAGHKPFTCSHSVIRNTWLNIHAVRWMRFSAHLSVHVFTISQNLTGSFFSSVVPWASCRLPDPLTVFCNMFAAV